MMTIEPMHVSLSELVNGYADNSETDEGIVGYGGKLNIRPKYQRNYVYDEKKRNAVIDTISKGFPLGTMYWVKNDDGTYEILDGQQRTISICEFMQENRAKAFSMSGLFGDMRRLRFGDLTEDNKKKFYDYDKFLVYVCIGGDDEERVRWFDTINIAGEVLSAQEVRNAQYNCAWLTSAKRYFSKKNSAAEFKSGKYIKLSGDNGWNRQGGLEKALRWFLNDVKMNDTKGLEDFMSGMKAQSNTDESLTAQELIDYFEAVIAWAKKLFPKSNRAKIGEVEWGILYNKYGKNRYDIDEIEKLVSELYADKDVTEQKGIYEYVLEFISTGVKRDKLLNIRKFDDTIKSIVYERQHHCCVDCGQHFELNEMHAHHIKRWADGGHTAVDNCAMLCLDCHNNRHRSE